MAEINIQKKRRSVWPWILAIIVIALIVWILLAKYSDYSERDEIGIFTDTTLNRQDTTDSLVNSKIDDFVYFTEDTTLSGDLVEYTKEGLHKFAVALNEIINQNETLNANIEQERDSLKEKLFDIEDLKEKSQAGEIRKAFIASADVLESVQEMKYDNLQSSVSELKIIAQALNPDQPVRNQENTIRNFFRRSGIILQQMKY